MTSPLPPNHRSPAPGPMSSYDQAAIADLWRRHFDTFEIAWRLNRPEWQIANFLGRWRGGAARERTIA